ncbi:hypothetical protein VSR01_17355 [Actinacidiphila sp. DG2A-62]|uniref:hypothetical protein n=1 Tax=Actinacidiphila sp. DG2A-62 TaxID=3108821 RepID=UPI002DBBCBBA|nr:hypothetical protein [Actinacidiphila sp. DG2A-62]MEC3995206.1 hypothetical protein [Actinacidiphila sp. DG2A-62]
MDQAPDQQPRIEGVKYRKVPRFREETTVIDGVPSTRRVSVDGWEPVPPREWDELILRGVTGIAITFTAIAVIGGTASLGGLLHPLVPAVISYGMGSVFAIAWIYCLAIEWLNRTAPDRARPAKVAGWFFLLLSMGAVAAYGHTLHQQWAGAFGACVDLIAKGAWWLLLREYAVPLDAGVAHWVAEQEQKLAGRALLAARVRRLNRRAAYQRAVGGAEFQAADAILSRAEAARSLTPPDEPPPVVRTVSEPVSSPVPPTSGQPKPTPAPVPAPSDSVPPVPPAAEDQGGEEQPGPVPQVAEITRPAIAAICRKEIAANSDVTDAELVAAVKAAGHPDRPSLADSVRRTAQRIDPTRKAKAS